MLFYEKDYLNVWQKHLILIVGHLSHFTSDSRQSRGTLCRRQRGTGVKPDKKLLFYLIFILS
jgi:hypothetical protein